MLGGAWFNTRRCKTVTNGKHMGTTPEIIAKKTNATNPMKL